MILALDTSGAETTIAMLDEHGEVVAEKVWEAGRTLARELLGEIEQLLSQCHSEQNPNCHPELDSGSTLPNNNLDSEEPAQNSSSSSRGFQNDKDEKVWDDKWKLLTGIIVFRGPGSFTGLRIGISVANALAYTETIPIVGTTGDNWRMDGLKKLRLNQNDTIVLPEYGAKPHITQPKK